MNEVLCFIEPTDRRKLKYTPYFVAYSKDGFNVSRSGKVELLSPLDAERERKLTVPVKLCLEVYNG